MASVSSLDADMRNLRMSRYTPAAANEVRTWIESTLNEKLPSGDLLEVLKDGVALCKLANLILPGIKYKSSPMPFIQMENISHFLKACEMPPLQLPAHDRFLTVDLFEAKDPAQVLQCLGAFSRQAHAIKPAVFMTTIGPKKAAAGGTMSPSTTGVGMAGTNGSASWRSTAARSPSPTKFSAERALSPSFTGGSTGSQGSRADANNKSPPGPVSSWSRKADESATAPAWNIHQYGYMGGASQGNQGISFGSRRQIVSSSPAVPSLAEKEKARKEKAIEEERKRQESEDLERRRRLEQDAEESRARADEERRWEDETRRQREDEKRRIEEQKREWEEQEKRWKEEEEARRKEDAQMQGLQKKAPERPRVPSSSILRGQTLSQYQRDLASQASGAANGSATATETPEQARVRELEKQLEEARERERQYQVEREQRLRQEKDGSRPGTAQTDTRPQSSAQSDKSWAGDEREILRSEWQNNRPGQPTTLSGTTTLQSDPEPEKPAPLPERPLPHPSMVEPDVPEATLPEEPPLLPQRMQPSTSASSIPSHVSQETSLPSSSPLGSPNRPLPTPNKEYEPYNTSSPVATPALQNRTDRFLATNTAPTTTAPRISSSQEAGQTSLEQQNDRDARLASQSKTKAGNWASKSLLEREMERERERQREWEADLEKTKAAPRDASLGTAAGQSWDVNQYGFMGGDNMNRGSGAGSGINMGAARRQILGPREMGSSRK